SPRDTNVFGHDWVMNSRSLNQLRLQYPARLRNQTGPPGSALWQQPGVFNDARTALYSQVYNFPSLHWGSTTGRIQWTNGFELKDDYAYTRSKHAFKFGGAVERFIAPEDNAPNLGTWTFSTDQFFNGSKAAIAALRNPVTF